MVKSDKNSDPSLVFHYGAMTNISKCRDKMQGKWLEMLQKERAAAILQPSTHC